MSKLSPSNADQLSRKMIMLARTRLCFDFQCQLCGLMKHTNEVVDDHLVVPEHSQEECDNEFKRNV
jgi:hypothetical protein